MKIAIFTRKKNQKLLDLLDDLQNQTEKFQLNIYTDENFSYWKWNVILTSWLNIAQKRNLAIWWANDDDFLLLLDDDNRIYDKDFLKKLKDFYFKIPYSYKVISPVVFYRNTNNIQSAWVRFSFLFWKVFVNKKIKWDFWETPGMWWNSLFWKWKDFKKAKFDEEIWFIREDLDYTYSLTKNFCKVLVVNLPINHMEKDKNWAEKSFLQGEWFYRKIKNRDIFVKKHWNLLQKLVFWGFWRWVSILIWKIKILFSKLQKH